MQDEKEFRPMRCAMWYAPGVTCIAPTESFSGRFCHQHFAGYQVSKGETWTDKFPTDVVFRSVGKHIQHETWFYERALEIQLKRRYAKKFWYANDKYNERFFYGTRLRTQEPK